jgi:endonuclease/exonuclease/phosphatase family metal-dependent hydrolase
MQLPSVQDAARCCKPQEIFVFCTHLDHRGMLEAARPFSAGLQIQAAQGEILLKEVETFCDADDADVPRLVLGDFNSWPGAGAHPVLLRHGYHEASQGASAQATFVGFGSGSLLARFQEWMCKVQIDYIFGTKNLELKGYSGRSRNLSDHCMISAQVRMARAET